MIDITLEGAHDKLTRLLPEGCSFKILNAPNNLLLEVFNKEYKKFVFCHSSKACHKIPIKDLEEFGLIIKSGRGTYFVSIKQ